VASEDNDGFLVVLTTVGDADQARELVTALVGERLIACGTIVDGTTSIYRWNASITREREVLIVMKTHRDRWLPLKTAVEARHPYDVPELLALPVAAGLEPYLGWVTAETRPG
jgi:periplasmic divalent cation tolerance protein